MLKESDSNAGVYRVLDQLLIGPAVPPGVKGAMFSIVDSLRASNAPLEDRRAAEAISIEIHKLETALALSDKPAIDDARATLKTLAGSWLQRRVFG